MSSPSYPSTPDRTPMARQTVRRSFTVPPKLSTPNKQPQIGAAEDIETLYVHPAARVISFNTSSASSRPSSRSGWSERDRNGSTLSWQTPTERTLATGPLEIYRVPGSVSFLHSGALLHAILPRSQCWCVDGVSIFAFRVLPEQYYRIELPAETDEDRELVEQLRVTFKKVLHYEKTACPFKRDFSVDLPETPEMPVRRTSRYSTDPVKRWKLNDIWRPEDWKPGGTTRSADQDNETNKEQARQKSLEALQGTKDLVDRSPSPSPRSEINSAKGGQQDTPDSNILAPPRPNPLSTMRSVTAPPQLTIEAAKNRKRLPAFALDQDVAETPDERNEEQSSFARFSTDQPFTPASATTTEKAEDSFVEKETLSTEHIPIPETSEKEAEEDLPGCSEVKESKEPPIQETSKIAVKASLEASKTLERSSTPAHNEEAEEHLMSEDDVLEHSVLSKESTPALSSDSEEHSWGEVVTPPETVRLRRPPKAATTAGQHLSSSTETRLHRTSSRESQERLTQGLVRKTCTILMSPPSHLIEIMLRIAARITHGALNMTIQSPIGAHRRIPGSWDLSDDEDEWDIDGYGFPKGNKVKPGGPQVMEKVSYRDLDVE